VRQGGRGNVETFAHIAARHRGIAAGNLPENFVAVRIGEGLGDELHLAVGEIDGLLRSGHGNDWMLSLSKGRDACAV
jgi:hypothetical protein